MKTLENNGTLSIRTKNFYLSQNDFSNIGIGKQISLNNMSVGDPFFLYWNDVIIGKVHIFSMSNKTRNNNTYGFKIIDLFPKLSIKKYSKDITSAASCYVCCFELTAFENITPNILPMIKIGTLLYTNEDINKDVTLYCNNDIYAKGVCIFEYGSGKIHLNITSLLQNSMYKNTKQSDIDFPVNTYISKNNMSYMLKIHSLIAKVISKKLKSEFYVREMISQSNKDNNSNFDNSTKFDKIKFEVNRNIDIDNNIIYFSDKGIKEEYNKEINIKTKHIYIYSSKELSRYINKNLFIKILSKVWNKYHDINITSINNKNTQYNDLDNSFISSDIHIIISNRHNKNLLLEFKYPYETLIPIINIIEGDDTNNNREFKFI